jgi:hypothetical protein
VYRDSDAFIDDIPHPLGALHVAASASGQFHAHGGAAAAVGPALDEANSLSGRKRPDTMGGVTGIRAWKAWAKLLVWREHAAGMA